MTFDAHPFEAEPEDAWHPDDPLDVLLANVARRFARFGITVTTTEGNRATAVTNWERLKVLEREIHRRRLGPADRHYAEMIDDDLAHIRARLEAADG